MREIGAGGQNWQFLQDERGLLYVANNFGVLEYDGASWRLIQTPLRNVVRSLALDVNGRIYAGSFGELGYLAPDESGFLGFVPLDTLLDEPHQGFADVWTTQVTPEGVYFQSRERLIRMTPKSAGAGPRREDWDIKVWEPEEAVLWTFMMGDELWTHQRGRGLSRMVDDSLHFVPGSEIFANDRTQVMLPLQDRGEDAYLFVGFTTGPYLYDGDSMTRFNTDAFEIMQESVVYKGTLLTDGSMAVATLTGGLLYLDRDGQFAGTMSTATGFSTNSITATLVDSSGMLWASPENSICQVETPSPLTRFGPSEGIEGLVSKVTRHNGLLYTTSTLGLTYFDPPSRRFLPARGMASGNPQSFGLLEFGDRLLAATSTGVYEVIGERVVQIRPSVAGSYEAQTLHRSLLDPNRILVATSAGVYSLYLDASGRWVDEGPIAGVDDYVTHIVEIRPGEIWLGPLTGGAVRVRFTDTSNRPSRIDRFDSRAGLTNDGGVSVFAAAGRVIFAQNEGVFLFDEATGRFLPDPLLGNAVSVGGSQEEFKVTEDHAGNIWTNFGGESAVLRPNGDGTYRTEKTPLLRFANSPATEIYPELNGVVWFGGNEVLIRYDPRVFKDYGKAYPALIRRVTVNDDSTLYGGAAGMDVAGLELPSGLNAIRFEYATPSYEDPRSNRYQTILEGFDEHWSAWTAENRRDYTNLPAGDYTFRVRGRNVYSQESVPASFSIRITPAWYASWWAWLLYVCIGGGAIAGIVRVRTRQLQHRSAELEEVVSLRTAELKDKNLELEKQRDELEQAYENVELLSRVGQDITSRLSIKEIIDTVYENVNALMDAAVFGIGIYDSKTNRIEMPATKENGITLPPFFFSAEDETRPAVWALKHNGEVFFNDYEKEYAEFFGKELVAALEGDNPQSMIYLPLINKDKAIGVITAQSFRKMAYTEYHLNILRNLAIYAAIAIDNAEAYRRLNATLGELSATVQNLRTTQQQLVTQEKLASLGSLTAGIAHEIKNPLNFVNNFAELVS
ncbi:MAG TPA: triple tyrosine motif-containing protein [Rhodothermia bacterium]